ncbi:Sua5/YciO/YrdC/YwlC family protein [Hydrogenophaga sp. SNF1]|uniref:L-threonylcarbamoyladenylate synthase n=1 Tax=Hydrogenophaga sp. SNF1 TaxID=3098762 RepID=UPI002ACC1D15|nr:Sua5/YciO/YrdC/YwlC family protein [Hydrogenophaga sp. SNF1]WQB83411.1 Sua5/YciO/YrdC/YwlC family protein [Hydrogenophaga sp. SNF1]
MADAVRRGGVVAYPTEAVFGLGCDPFNAAAVQRIYRLKRRPTTQGFLLIAASEAQLDPFVDWARLAPEALAEVRASWPGPHTWVLPRGASAPAVVAGAHQGIAVRVTAHGPAAGLCRAAGGALVSTSANRHGQPAARSVAELWQQFAGADLDALLDLPLGGLERPTPIRDALSGRSLRGA